MAKGTYSGGGSLIGPGNGETYWSSHDPAEEKREMGAPISRQENRASSKKEIEQEEQQEAIRSNKALRSFISQCVTAYASGNLTAIYPVAPKSLAKRVKSVGGNIRWLSRDPQYQSLFHKAYCRLRNEHIPFERVWDRNSP